MYSVHLVNWYNQYKINVAGTYPDNYYSKGKMVFITGANAGITRDISYNLGNQFVLFQPFPLKIETTDTVKISAGCDKTVYTCFAQSS